jgi:hypothetical protein
VSHRLSFSLVALQPSANLGAPENWTRSQLANRLRKIGGADSPIRDGLSRDIGHGCDLVDSDEVFREFRHDLSL